MFKDISIKPDQGLPYFNIALSQQDINNYMNCLVGSEPGLLGFWNFEEGSGNTAYDQTGNNNAILTCTCQDPVNNGPAYITNTPVQDCPLTNSNGCDSVLALNLTINQSDTVYTNVIACDSYTWDGTTYDSSGTYYSPSIPSNSSLSFDGVDNYLEFNQSIIQSS